MDMPIRGTKIVLIGQEMYELWAPENEGLVFVPHIGMYIGINMSKTDFNLSQDLVR